MTKARSTDILCIYIAREVICMLTKIKPWGNSHGIRLSRELLIEAQITPSDPLEIFVLNGDIIIRKQFRHKTLEERAEEYAGKLGAYQEFDWGKPAGREFW